MNDLENARKEIARIDAEMARLFEERMSQCVKIAAFKRERGLPIRDTAREDALLTRNCSLIKDQDVESYYVQFLKNMMDLSCQYQSRLTNGMRVTYSGVEGAFAYIAAKKMFPDAGLVAYPDFSSAYQAVENGECDCAVLPLENNVAGEVGAVMDLIFSGSLYVNQVIDLPVVHNLVACPDAELGSIRTVVSHQQALDQCGRWIHEHGFETQSYSNTAMAAKYVMEKNDPSVAAIAAEETAELFGLKVLERGVNDSGVNTTRFAAFSRVQNRPSSSARREDENFILVFTVQNEAGALAQTLNIIGAHGFNMRSVRSRPMKNLQWNYFFYIEAEGNINSENGQDMLRELSAICAKLRMVGTYYASNVG